MARSPRVPPPEPLPEPEPSQPAVPLYRRRLVRGLAKLAFALVLAGGLLLGIARLGNWAGQKVADDPRYALRIADISCDAPGTLDRPTFLEEVRAVGPLPETVSAVDPTTRDRLAAAFAKHPWVESVTGVTLESGKIEVGLRFRLPALAITVVGEPESRAVDAAGVLLPASVDPAGLPLLVTAVPPTPTHPGEPWPNSDVTRAAELSKAYPARRIQKTETGWRITQSDGRVLVIGP